jgi:hypothetical protein
MTFPVPKPVLYASASINGVLIAGGLISLINPYQGQTDLSKLATQDGKPLTDYSLVNQAIEDTANAKPWKVALMEYQPPERIVTIPESTPKTKGGADPKQAQAKVQTRRSKVDSTPAKPTLKSSAKSVSNQPKRGPIAPPERFDSPAFAPRPKPVNQASPKHPTQQEAEPIIQLPNRPVVNPAPVVAPTPKATISPEPIPQPDPPVMEPKPIPTPSSTPQSEIIEIPQAVEPEVKPSVIPVVVPTP